MDLTIHTLETAPAGSTALLQGVPGELGFVPNLAADSRYGVAFHSTVLGGLGVADDEIARMRSGTEPQDSRTAAVTRWPGRSC